MIGPILKSLRVQLVLLILVTLSAAQVVSLWLFSDERTLAIQAAMGFEAAGRAANIARLIEEAPQDLHASILRAANSPLVRFELGTEPLVQHSNHSDGGQIEARVRALLSDRYSRAIRVELHQVEGQLRHLPNAAENMTELQRQIMAGELSAVEMNLAISITGGQWLNVSTRFERPPFQWPMSSILTFGLTAAALFVVVSWFAMSHLMAPLRRLVRAADNLGRGEDVASLPEKGPQEMRDLTAGFNRMQQRLSRYVADRTSMLAAIGHDLRSPITSIRVRAEMVEDDETRDSLVASAEEMQAMIDATLNFARGLSESEPVQAIDIATFLTDIKSGMIEPFELSAGPDVSLRLRPSAMKRALRNVIENAIRYGETATVAWSVVGDEVFIEINDEGPGIPETELERVFDPFFRLEESRSLETGGHGLGFSIARSIFRAHGGDITLANRPQGGLSAEIRLPITNISSEIGERNENLGSFTQHIHGTTGKSRDGWSRRRV